MHCIDHTGDALGPVLLFIDVTVPDAVLSRSWDIVHSNCVEERRKNGRCCAATVKILSN